MNLCIFAKKANSVAVFTQFSSCFIALILLLASHRTNADYCGCGQRCDNYIEDLQCMRCCSGSVRRSIPLSAYPVEQLLELKQSLVNKGLEDSADRKMMVEIIESLKQISKRESDNNRRGELDILEKMLNAKSRTTTEEKRKRSMQMQHPVLNRLNDILFDQQARISVKIFKSGV